MMTTRSENIASLLKRLNEAASAINGCATFMEVCGTHTMSAFRCGLHSLIPANITLLSGPGCPVCVTAQGDIDLLITLASDYDVTLCTYGDMLRVPGQRGSLEAARSSGADVRIVYSALDAVKLAGSLPERQVVFAAVGFETTAPATAIAVQRAEALHLDNFTALASHKLVIPAMLALLDGGQVNLDGFLCPGHVSVIIGSDAYLPVVNKYGIPCVIGGFENRQMASSLAVLAEQMRDGRTELINDYREAVKPQGNEQAQKLLGEVFEPADVRWRGLGVIPQSGLVLCQRYGGYDAKKRFDLTTPKDCEPRGCRCGEVIRGLVRPDECKLFNTVCTPINPIGPCMVSSEGTCQAWFKYHRTPKRQEVYA